MKAILLGSLGGLILCAIAGGQAYREMAYGARLPHSTEAVGLWTASSGWKIAPERPLPEAQTEAVRIAAARNEAEAVQFVLRPRQALKGLRIEVQPLSGSDGATLPADAVDVRLVQYLDITQPTDDTGVRGLWPDPLQPITGPLDLEAGRNQAFWVCIKPPKDAAAGVYTGVIRLAADGYEAEVSLQVDVFGFTLPDRMTCVTAFGFDPGNVYRYHGVTEPADQRAVLDQYFACLSAHHIAPYNSAPLDPFRVTWPDVPEGDPSVDPATLKPTFDWSAWDAAMTRAIDQYHFNSFSIPIQGMGGGTFHERIEPSLLGFGEGTPQYEAAFTAYCREVQEHLREKGWLDEAFVYWFDEPEPRDYDFVRKGFERLNKAAPDILGMLTEQPDPALSGLPDIWCLITPEYKEGPVEERLQAGDAIWWYVCTGPKAPYATLFIDHPGTEMRVWLWQTWQRHINGILIWQTNYWHSPTAYPDDLQNPYADPMSWTVGYGVPSGTKQPWGNGDGRFLYPPLAAAGGKPDAPVLDGPVPSIRLEMLRDGIEDYEYLVILECLLKERGDILDEAERAEYEALLAVPEDITVDLTRFTFDPAPIEARREAVARAIERLQASS